jgi:hypothetical protein
MTTQRFGVVDAKQAFVLGVLEEEPHKDDYGAHLVEYNATPEGKARLVGHDACEPEDATLYRSFSWVPDELNKLADENARLRQAIEELPDPERDEEVDTEDLLQGALRARKALVSP